MARPRPDRKREPTSPAERRVLPMELQVGDRITDETGDWEIIGRPYTTNAGKDAPLASRESASPTSPRYGPGARTSASA
jgi:hypothetical protein